MSVDPDWAARRAALTRICTEVGFPAPDPETGLGRWADEALDSALAPRGGPDWAEGHRYAIEALQAFLAGDEPGCRIGLSMAVTVVCRAGRRRCACDAAGLTFDDHGRRLCVRCLGRA